MAKKKEAPVIDPAVRCTSCESTLLVDLAVCPACGEQVKDYEAN